MNIYDLKKLLIRISKICDNHKYHILNIIKSCYAIAYNLRCMYQFVILTTFSGNLCPGRYLTFSCVSLIISVNFLPFIISSNTYIVTRSSKFDKRFAFTPTILAIADPLFLKINQKSFYYQY